MAIIRELNQEQRFDLLDRQLRETILQNEFDLNRLERRLRETALAKRSDAE